jgi:hypothetical protein
MVCLFALERSIDFCLCPSDLRGVEEHESIVDEATLDLRTTTGRLAPAAVHEENEKELRAEARGMKWWARGDRSRYHKEHECC